MKKIILSLIAVSIVSCSKDNDCQSKRNEINAYYDKQVELIRAHPGPKLNHPDVKEIDYRQLDLVNTERNRKLSEACN